MPRSNRSRSTQCGRDAHRNRTRSRHRSSSRRNSRRKLKEKNFWSALCSMVAIVIMCTSLAEPRWISLHGGGCRLRDCIPLDHIGTYQFFYSGQFVDSYDFTCQDGMSGSHLVYKYGEDSFNCKLALKSRIIIIFFEKKSTVYQVFSASYFFCKSEPRTFYKIYTNQNFTFSNS